MTNEELAEIIQRADSKSAKAELWENNKGLIYHFARQYYNPDRPYSVEDLAQQGYFALLYAVKSYDKEKGYKFTTYLHFSFQRAIRKMMNAEPYYMSLDTPLGEEKEMSLSDVVPDDNALEELEIALNLTGDQQAINNALERLESSQRDLIISIYFHGETRTSISERLSHSIEAIRQRERKALRILRKDKELLELYQDTIQDKQLRRLCKSAERPERVESRQALKCY